MAEATRRAAAEAFNAFTGWLHALIPRQIRRFLPPTFIGFALINSSTFLLDLVLLSLSTRQLRWPYPVAVSVSFAVAASVAFVLNKVLNFRAHGETGRQSGRYVLVLVTNYALWILGFSWMLNALGVPPELARILAAFAEGIYIYLLSRLWVFRRRLSPKASAAPTPLKA
ncbi:GtrA family protein [uncultured Tessaracoccus sp.]|uniref:GtrA family protein n=1 Tax=uncultured Tessaracoccus sp. TaxID=905023 RepID=UPI00261C119B|nr:GtrA family protein [uncultured Tessaracoccus sp.]